MSATRTDAPSHALLGEVLVARQPILDRHLMVVAQELLYREVTGDPPASEEGRRHATAVILIEGVMGLGRELLGEGERAHVNVPASLLVDGSLLALPTTDVVLEVDRDLVGTPEHRQAIAAHRAGGYRIALDAITPGDVRLELVGEVDYVKVDVAASGEAAALELIAWLADRDVVVIAEKVEEPAVFDQVIAAGAMFAQGFFFTRPRAVRGMRPVGLSSTHLMLLRACMREELDLDELERLIRSDLTLADRFLAMIASATHRWGPVTSVREGLIVLGERALQRWVHLLIMSSIVRDQHPELLLQASVRARYCEVLEHRLGGGRGLDAFAAGMFSILGPDAVLREEAVASLPVSDGVRDALRGQPGPLRTLLEIQVAAEGADWMRLVALGRSLGLTATELAAAHVDALAWGRQVAGSVHGG